MKTTLEILATMVRNAMTNTSKQTRRTLSKSKDDDLYNYISNSDNWENTTTDMDDWNGLYRAINITHELEIVFILGDIVVNYTPELKRKA